MNTKSLEELRQENNQRIAPFKAKYPCLFSKLEWLQIEDGWLDLVDRLSAKIEVYIDGYVPEELRDQIYYEQIKQKFGQLRVYMSHHIPYIQGAIDVVESISDTVCEKCGGKSQMRNIRGWITSLCDLHFQEEIK